MSAEELERQFAARGVPRGGIRLFEPADALDLVARARTLSVRVLGIDGFRLGPDFIQPDQEHSVDFTRGSHQPSDSWSAAQEFLRSRRDVDRMFELVLE